MRKPPPKKRVPPTRERVLDVAVRLFNDAGMDRTTTKRIADAAEINEGNLYYHFSTKEALAVALLDRMEGEAVALLGHGIRQGPDQPGDARNLEVYTEVLRQWFLLTWNYRFIFRDVASSASAPALTTRLRTMARRLEEAARAVFSQMAADGLLAGSPEAIETMLTNLWIVSGHWMNYLTLRDGPDAIGPDRIEWGMKQLRSLYAPFLTIGPEGLERTDEAGPAPIPRTRSHASAKPP